jgi:exopolysaccharide biosynthesis polyprenyl glycosylphosphotransferase|uniref:Sugar transferase n=1 Tax=Desulfobacca acetoxidans TaxID=60893 RepID=A0A7C5EU18_9BACT
MLLPQRRSLVFALKILDQIILAAAFLLAAAAVSEDLESLSFSKFLLLRVRITNFALYLIFAWCWYGLFSLTGLYHFRPYTSWQTEGREVLTATSLGTMVLLFFCQLFSVSLATPTFLFFLWLYTTGATLASRLLLRFLLQHFRQRGIAVQNVVMVGTNRRALDFARKLDSRLELGYRVLGFVDDPWSGMDRFLESGYPLLTNFAGFNDFLKKNVVDEVFIDLPLNTYYRQVQEMVRHCLSQGIPVRFLSDSFYLLRNMNLARVKFDQFEGVVLLSVQTGVLSGWPILAKRLFDFVAALLLLVLFSPVFLVIAALIKLTSPGPVFFVQTRVGLNKRLFRLYKFRTMVDGAEERQEELSHLNEADGPVFKIRNDPRVTPLGRWLRRTSLDELPQLINVLLGDMSLVGPRPLPLRDYQGFNTDWHRRRFSVRPGITCLWQIKGRSDLPFEKWMALDMYYIDHWSFCLDLRILARTLPAILREKGAY